MKNKTFQTSDLYLSSALNILLQIEPDYRVQNNTTIFCYQMTPELIKAMDFYNGGGSLNAFAFAQNIKRMRGLMIQARKQNGNRRYGYEEQNFNR